MRRMKVECSGERRDFTIGLSVDFKTLETALYVEARNERGEPELTVFIRMTREEIEALRDKIDKFLQLLDEIEESKRRAGEIAYES